MTSSIPTTVSVVDREPARYSAYRIPDTVTDYAREIRNLLALDGVEEVHIGAERGEPDGQIWFSIKAFGDTSLLRSPGGCWVVTRPYGSHPLDTDPPSREWGDNRRSERLKFYTDQEFFERYDYSSAMAVLHDGETPDQPMFGDPLTYWPQKEGAIDAELAANH